jgi:4'-phosphopantetheinyl transferase
MDAEVLSSEERARAERYRFERDRRAFLFHHTTLRRILGLYLGLGPACVRIEKGSHGKPALAAPYGEWKFNMAHSGDAGLYAVCRGREVGVDIEWVRPMPDAGRIAARFYTAREREALDGSPDSFFQVWVRKEALMKATGEGLSGLESARPEGWSVVDLPAVPGYAASLAVEGSAPPLKAWRYVAPAEA